MPRWLIAPTPPDDERRALFGFLTGKPHDAARLPEQVRALEAFRAGDEATQLEILEAHRKALALREGLVREFPDDPEARNNLGGTLNNLGVVLNGQGHPQDALAMYLRAVEQGEAAFAKAPQVTLYGIYLGTQYGNVASMLRALGRNDEAIPAYQRSISWRRKPWMV